MNSCMAVSLSVITAGATDDAETHQSIVIHASGVWFVEFQLSGST